MTMSVAHQARAFSQSAAVRARDDLVALHVRGDDRLSWLNGQVTSDVRTIRHGDGLYALAVTVRGKIMADLWVLDRGDQLCVLLPKAALAHVLESFERQIIMEDVTLAADPTLRVISVQGPRASEVIAAAAEVAIESHHCDELGHGGAFVLVNDSELPARLSQLSRCAEALGGCGVGEAGFELARLRAGRGVYGRDFGEQHYPQEAGLKGLAVSFSKGCYLGQEVVCTLENRGKLTRRLVQLQGPIGAPLGIGAELRDAGGGVVGQLTSVAADPEAGHLLALGYVKRSSGAAGSELDSGGCRLHVGAPAGLD
jgi:folate-binding protein YgfZ